MPVGGVIISDPIAATFDDRVFPGGLTYSGHPLACASIVASIDAMKEEGIVENAKRIGEDVLGPGLRELAERHPVIGEVRGLGVFWALDLVTDRATREPLAPYGGSSPAMAELVGEMQEARRAAVHELQPPARRAAVQRLATPRPRRASPSSTRRSVRSTSTTPAPETGVPDPRPGPVREGVGPRRTPRLRAIE